MLYKSTGSTEQPFFFISISIPYILSLKIPFPLILLISGFCFLFHSIIPYKTSFPLYVLFFFLSTFVLFFPSPSCLLSFFIPSPFHLICISYTHPVYFLSFLLKYSFQSFLSMLLSLQGFLSLYPYPAVIEEGFN